MERTNNKTELCDEISKKIMMNKLNKRMKFEWWPAWANIYTSFYGMKSYGKTKTKTKINQYRQQLLVIEFQANIYFINTSYTYIHTHTHTPNTTVNRFILKRNKSYTKPKSISIEQIASAQRADDD